MQNTKTMQNYNLMKNKVIKYIQELVPEHHERVYYKYCTENKLSLADVLLAIKRTENKKMDMVYILNTLIGNTSKGEVWHLIKPIEDQSDEVFEFLGEVFNLK